MQPLNAVLLGVLTLVVLVFGLVHMSDQSDAQDRLDELTCLERIHATAAVTLLVPDANVDPAGRVEAE